MRAILRRCKGKIRRAGETLRRFGQVAGWSALPRSACVGLPTLETAMRLLDYIAAHGHRALALPDGTLRVTSLVSRECADGVWRASEHTETIPATWRAVRAWLGY